MRSSGIEHPLLELVKIRTARTELVDLSLAIIAINGWNRLAIPFRAEPGSYRTPAAPK